MADSYNTLTDKPLINNVELTGNKSFTDLGLLSGKGTAMTVVDGKVIVSTNSASNYASLSTKPSINGHTVNDTNTGTSLGLQDKLTAGSGISISNSNVISASFTAGNGITITNGTINATPYVGGYGVNIQNNVISTQLWELINLADFSEQTYNCVEFLQDLNSNNFSLSSFRLVFELLANKHITEGNIQVNDSPSDKCIGRHLNFCYYENSINKKCIFQTIESMDGIGTISINSCGGETKLIQDDSYLFGNKFSEYSHFAPFTKIRVSWEEACRGKIWLIGIREVNSDAFEDADMEEY